MEPISDEPNGIFKAFSLLPMLLSFQRHSITNEIYLFKEYIIDNRDNINKQQIEFKARVDKELTAYPDQEQEIHEHYEEQYYQYTQFYPSIFHNSTLLTLYSFLEFNLKQLCDTTASFQGLKIKVGDLGGQNYVEKSRKYLRLVVELNLSDLDNLWQLITFYQKIRNKIVHHNSSIVEQRNRPLNEQPLYGSITSNPYLKLHTEKGTLVISDDHFLLDFCDLIENFFVPVIQKVEALAK